MWKSSELFLKPGWGSRSRLPSGTCAFQVLLGKRDLRRMGTSFAFYSCANTLAGNASRLVSSMLLISAYHLSRWNVIYV